MISKKDFEDVTNFDSAFNMALSALIRIDHILTTCSIANYRRDLSRWFSGLMVLSLQVKYDFDKDEITKNKEFRDDIFLLQREYESYESRGLIKNFIKFGEYFNLLEEYEDFLRKALDKRGMLMKTKGEKRLF